MQQAKQKSRRLEIAGHVGPLVWPTAFHRNPPTCPTRHPSVSLNSHKMEVTDYVFKEREEVLFAGDYNSYRAHATRKLHKLRKKLGQTTAKGRKYTAKPQVTPEDVGENRA